MPDTATINSQSEKPIWINLEAGTYAQGSGFRKIPERHYTPYTALNLSGAWTTGVFSYGDPGRFNQFLSMNEQPVNPPADGFLWTDAYGADAVWTPTVPAFVEFDTQQTGSLYQNPVLGGSTGTGGSTRPSTGMVYPRRI